MNELNFGLTLNSYTELAKAASNKFSSVLIGEGNLSDGSMIWRHDVDFSILAARSLAEVDSSLGIRANFFIRLGSETYNLLEKRNLEFLHEIHDMGHSIGLHFDSTPSDLKDENKLNQALKSKQLIFEEATGLKIKSFSFHNTSLETKKFTGTEYGGLANAYSLSYFDTNFYSSDSGGYWKYKPMLEMINDPKVVKIQALTHPEWWLEVDTSPFAKINIAAKQQYEYAINKYLFDLKSFGLPLNRGVIDFVETEFTGFDLTSNEIVHFLNSRKFQEVLLLTWYVANRNKETKFEQLNDYLLNQNYLVTSEIQEIFESLNSFLALDSINVSKIDEYFPSHKQLEIAATFCYLFSKAISRN